MLFDFSRHHYEDAKAKHQQRDVEARLKAERQVKNQIPRSRWLFRLWLVLGIGLPLFLIIWILNR